jgi:hypothetical protein
VFKPQYLLSVDTLLITSFFMPMLIVFEVQQQYFDFTLSTQLILQIQQQFLVAFP